ncbi:MAG: hypothetical protein WDW36_002401 [Sanguina aurantia]
MRTGPTDLGADHPAVSRFSTLLQFQTNSNVSAEHHLQQPQQFSAMMQHLAASYPLTWSQLAVEYVGSGNFSLLIQWRGTDPALLPVLYVSHYDVVPVTVGSERDWHHPPYAGVVKDGVIWGRGALDVKIGVAALFEAVEGLLAEGFTPARGLFITIGQDEEVGGSLGAAQAAAVLARRGVTFEVVIDEGGAVMTDGLAPVTSRPVAMVGVAEKGYTGVVVTLHSSGGHAAMPPLDGSDIGSQTSRLLAALRARPFPAHGLPGATAALLRALVPLAPPWARPLLWNARKGPASWLLARIMSLASPLTASMVHTTTVLTSISGGVADNVMPQTARLGFNTRPVTGTSLADVLAHFRGLVGPAKVNATVRLSEAFTTEASGLTSAEGPHFKLLAQAIQELWHNTEGSQPIPVLPYMVSGGTDSKHFQQLSANGILRFVPMEMSKAAGELASIHATNERVHVDSFLRAICTYRRIVTLFSAREL